MTSWYRRGFFDSKLQITEVGISAGSQFYLVMELGLVVGTSPPWAQDDTQAGG